MTASPTYDAQDRLLSDGACSYTYRATGERQTKICLGGVTTYDYDVFGNLRNLMLPNGTHIEYVIDGQNRRVGKKVNGTLVEAFLYRSHLQPSAWLDGTGAMKATFVYGLQANVPEYMVKNGVTYRLVTDQVGSVRLAVDAGGHVAEPIDYDAFGNVLSDSVPGFQPFGFAGGLRDVDAGLTRFGARDYDPAAGMWTAKDAIGFEGSLNFYGYAGNDPVDFVDPTGLIVRFGDAAGRRLWGVVRAVPEGARMADHLESSPNEYVIYGDATLPGTVAGVFGDLADEQGHFRRGAKTCPSGLSVDLRVDSKKARKAARGGLGIPGPAGRLAHEMLHAGLLDFKTTGTPLPTSFLVDLLPGSVANGELGEAPHRLIDWWSNSRWGRR